MNGHVYGHAGSVATHRVRTDFGTFHLCPACVNAKHAGLKHGAALTRIPTVGPESRACDCEHVSHMPDESADAVAALDRP